MTTVPENSATPAPPEPRLAPPPAQAAWKLAAGRLTLGARASVFAALLLAALAGIYAVYLHHRISLLQQQLAQNMALLGGQTRDLGVQYRSNSEQSMQTHAKLLQLETRMADFDAQRARTDTALQTLASASETALLTELRASLQSGQQQAQLSGNAQPLLAALADADKRLTAARQPKLAALQRAVAQDMARFKNTPLSDVPQLVNQLDGLLQRLDALPLQGSQRPALAAPKAAKRQVISTANASRWLRLWQDVRDSVTQLVRVRTIESTEAAMLAPEQTLYVREHLRLRLLGARLALLSRQPELARRDMEAAQLLLGKYFDNDAPLLKSSRNTLAEVSRLSQEGALPSISNTLSALAAVSAAGK